MNMVQSASYLCLHNYPGIDRCTNQLYHPNQLIYRIEQMMGNLSRFIGCVAREGSKYMLTMLKCFTNLLLSIKIRKLEHL